MADFTIYKTNSGIIESSGSTNVSIDFINLENDQSIIEGIYEVEQYKIIDGSAVEQTVDFWGEVRLKRNFLLSESDWTQMQDSALTDIKKLEWTSYRQSLRDLPDSNASALTIDNIIFPNKPVWWIVKQTIIQQPEDL